LNQSLVGDNDSLLHFSQLERGVIPSQLDYVRYCVAENKVVSKSQTLTTNTELDLVQVVEYSTSHARLCPSREVLPGELKPLKTRKIAISQLPLEANLVTILNHAAHNRAEANANDCNLAVEENGLVCYVPSEAKVGDLICKFPKSDILVIIRRLGSSSEEGDQSCQVIGRAINYLKYFNHEAYKIHDEALPDDWFDTKHRNVTIRLSLEALEIITRPSAVDVREAERDWAGNLELSGFRESRRLCTSSSAHSLSKAESYCPQMTG